jgi:hypothetical protein
MPAYNTQNPPPALMGLPPLNQFTVWKAETLLVNEVSQQVSITRHPVLGAVGIRVEIDFSANPGNVTINVLESDDDMLGAAGYDQVPAAGQLTQANLVAGPNGASTRLCVDLQPFSGQFAALQVAVAPTNAVTATARITRAA